MKKLTRNERAKLIERTKTAVIVLLTLSCLFSGYYVFDIYRDQGGVGSFWWGTNSAVSFVENASESVSNGALNTLLQLSEAETIMINRVENRDAISAENQAFSKAAELADAVIKETHLQPDTAFSGEVSVAEWQGAMKANSIYVRFGKDKSSSFEAGFYKIAASKLAESIPRYEELIILPDNAAKLLNVYIRNRKDAKTVKVRFETPLAKTVNEFIDEHGKISSKMYAFAYELNLDKLDAGQDAASLDSMFVLPVVSVSAYNVVADVPRAYKTGLNFTKTTDFTTGLINVFGYNPNTVRQYVNSDDALIFVGETGSLSVHPEGYIEYKALGTKDGVSLAAQTQTDVYTVTTGLINVLNKVYSLSGVIPEYCDSKLKFAEITQLSNAASGFKIGFDYFVDSRKVKFSEEPAILAVINDGVLTELKMQVKTVKKTDKVTETAEIFEAIDSYCKENPKVKRLTDGKLIYKFAGNGAEMSAEWEIQGVE
ncbi:MAG: hypothetical protein IKW64_00805 [Clostridia bacterium]|nr:hypothetical protein [Clostridia bacterium]